MDPILAQIEANSGKAEASDMQARLPGMQKNDELGIQTS